MKFDPGVYYVGAPGFVLPNDDLRMLFTQCMDKTVRSGPRELFTSCRRENNEKLVFDFYWLALLPFKQGTIYSQNGQAWGFDWYCFGVIPWRWIENKSSYEEQKIDFTEPFICSFTEDSITIGHLHFTFNPK